MSVIPLYSSPAPRGDWLDLLRAAVAATSMAAVAERTGLSRTTVSLVLAGKYPAKTLDAVERKVRDSFELRLCPHLGQTLDGDACRRYRDRALPRSSARDLRHWRACQTCPHNPGATHES